MSPVVTYNHADIIFFGKVLLKIFKELTQITSSNTL